MDTPTVRELFGTPPAYRQVPYDGEPYKREHPDLWKKIDAEIIERLLEHMPENFERLPDDEAQVMAEQAENDLLAKLESMPGAHIGSKRHSEVRDLQNRFKYHAPRKDQVPVYEHIRNLGYDMAYRILELCPDSRERDEAVKRIEEAVMWANAAIARRSQQ